MSFFQTSYLFLYPGCPSDQIVETCFVLLSVRKNPARRAFYFIGKFNEVSGNVKNSPVQILSATGEFITSHSLLRIVIFDLLSRIQHFFHQTNILRCRSAAAADNACTRVYQNVHIFCKRRRIHAVDCLTGRRDFRQAGIRFYNNRYSCHFFMEFTTASS